MTGRPRFALTALAFGYAFLYLPIGVVIPRRIDDVVATMALSEAVRIPLHKPGCFSVCLSSQVGCAMGCTFCATGRLGLTRNLAAWEMVAACLTVRDEAPGRTTGVVFQGQGEPFHNYDEVIRAARVLSHPCGGKISAAASVLKPFTSSWVLTLINSPNILRGSSALSKYVVIARAQGASNSA